MNAGDRAPDRPSRPRTSSLGRRLAIATVSIALAFSALVIAAELLTTYSIGTANARRRLDEIGSSIVPSLAAGVWQVDFDRVQLLLDGIAGLPGVTHVALTTREGELFEHGKAGADVLLRRTYTLRHGNGDGAPLGSLDVVIGTARISAQVRSQAVASGLVAIIAVVSSSLLMMLLFRRWITSHLAVIANYAATLDLRRLGQPLVLIGKAPREPPDELDRVARAFNRMRESLQAELELRNRHEAELRLHRDHLEDLVRARTAELDEKNRVLESQKEQIQRLADTDSLTGVSSRRRFYEFAEHEIARSLRAREPLSLLMIDVDHFKRINDEHGHAAGDETLRAIGACCLEQLRQVDTIGRLGGEEFAVLLPGTDTAGALQTAERLRAALATLRVATAQGGAVRFSISIGIGMLDASEPKLDALLKCADTALYQAKHEGRDCVRVNARCA